jgi:2,3,4,5-tetrahydropyridine-2,6-dicarboxylate N-succinyltransferase
MTDQLAATIDAAWDARDSVSTATTGEVRDAVEAALGLLDSGKARVAEKIDGAWAVNQWLKKAVLLSFRLNAMDQIPGGPGGAPWWDKVDSKFLGWDAAKFADAGFYLWADVRRTGLSDTEFARGLYAEYNVTVLPGSYLARDAHGSNPGRNRIRMALVAEVDEGLEAANRIVQFCKDLKSSS